MLDNGPITSKGGALLRPFYINVILLQYSGPIIDIQILLEKLEYVDRRKIDATWAT